MGDTLLLGFGRWMIPIPRFIWRRVASREARSMEAGQRFMSDEHHAVRDYVVAELPRSGEPLSAESIAGALGFPPDRVRSILDDLEKHMTFVCRYGRTEVNWAYPVTVDETPHRVEYGSGEKGFAAWAVDSIAVPFVQGHLREKPVSVVISSECAHCSRPLTIELDQGLSYRVVEDGAEPLIFSPLVNFQKLGDPCIIDKYWRKNVFFWSEEHAREHRRSEGGPLGIYMRLDQATYITRAIQGALFAVRQNP